VGYVFLLSEFGSGGKHRDGLPVRLVRWGAFSGQGAPNAARSHCPVVPTLGKVAFRGIALRGLGISQGVGDVWELDRLARELEFADCVEFQARCRQCHAPVGTTAVACM
jgi:hypothetical protein